MVGGGVSTPMWVRLRSMRAVSVKSPLSVIHATSAQLGLRSAMRHHPSVEHSIPTDRFQREAEVPRCRAFGCSWLRSQPIDATHWRNRSAGITWSSVFLGRSFGRLTHGRNRQTKRQATLHYARLWALGPNHVLRLSTGIGRTAMPSGPIPMFTTIGGKWQWLPDQSSWISEQTSQASSA